MNYFFYLMVPLILFFVLLYLFAEKRKLEKRFKITRTDFKDLEDTDEVHVYGRTKLFKPTFSPISKHKCCYYQCTVFQTSRFGKNDVIKNNSSDWEVLKNEEYIGDFLLEVNLEPVLILTKNSKSLLKVNVDTHSEKLFDTATFEQYWPNVKSFLEKHGFRVSNVYDKNEKRVKEILVANDEQLAVVGKGTWMRTAEFPDIAPYIDNEKVYVISGTEKSPVVFTNINSLLWG